MDSALDYKQAYVSVPELLETEHVNTTLKLGVMYLIILTYVTKLRITDWNVNFHIK